jgi:hypothetical protein
MSHTCRSCSAETDNDSDVCDDCEPCPDCDNDSCALNGGMDSCQGQVVQCHPAP